MEGSDRAKGGNVKSIFSDFEITNAAELEAHVAMNAIAARANFDKYYAERLDDVSKLWTEQKRRLDVREPLEVPNLIIDCGVPGFDCARIPALFAKHLKAREDAAKERDIAKAAGDIAADIHVSVTANQNLPLQLTLRGCDYTNVDKVIAAIRECPEMLRISLADNGLEADECTAIADLVQSHPTVQALDLSGNKIGAEGLAKIADAFLVSAHTITDLDLGLNELSKSAVKYLDKILTDEKCALQRLQLAGNKLGIYGAGELAESLGRNTSLLSVGLQNNNMGTDGITKLLDMLHNESQKNTTVCQLALDSNKADDSVVDLVLACIQRNEHLHQLRSLGNAEEAARVQRINEIDDEWKLLELLERKTRDEQVAAAKLAVKLVAKPAAKPAAKAAAKPAAKPGAAVSAKKQTPAPTKRVAGSGVAAAKALSPSKKPVPKRK